LLYSKLSNILNDINTILLPRVCFGCNAHLHKGERLICTVCRNELPLTEYSFNDINTVDRIFYGRIDIKKASSFLFYTKNGRVQRLISFLKYKNQEQIGSFLGDWYGSELKHDPGLPSIDFVVPVPLHKSKLKSRGYNQVSLFAKQLSNHLDATYADNVLLKKRRTKTQTLKNRLGRSLNSQAQYTLYNPHKMANKRVLLVDDVVTTGATLEACATALKEITGISIYITTMAVTV